MLKNLKPAVPMAVDVDEWWFQDKLWWFQVELSLNKLTLWWLAMVVNDGGSWWKIVVSDQPE